MYRVDIWRWSLELPEDRLATAREFLSDDERARADRFVQAVHRDRHIAGRARLRQILGTVTGRDPRDIVFRYGAEGKPSVDDGPEFNLSHSGDLAVLAVSPDGAVGIDVEQQRPIEEAVARHHFSPAELAELDGLAGAGWLDGFYRCWTRKEAVIKADGRGLTMPLASFDVSLRPDRPARLARIEGDTVAAWRLAHFDPRPGWAGALAARTGGQELAINWRAGATGDMA